MVHPNSTPSREGSTNSTISQEGSNSPSSNSGNTRSQLGNSSASPQAVRWSIRLRASQADSAISLVDSEVSQASGASPPNSTTSQATSNAGSKEAGAIPLIAIIISRQVAGTQLGLGYSKLPKRTVLLPRQVVLAPREATLPPNKSRANNPQGSSMEEPNPKWVINLSSKPLTQAQRSVLAKGPNFAVSPRHPPNLEYITAIESACTKLSQQDAEELRADINQVLRSSHPQTQFNQSTIHSSKGT